jgi:nucleoside-diphosphate-sugar epimerase
MADDYKKILVTGANGLIGKAVYQRLVELAYDVTGIDNNSRNHKNKTIDDSVIITDVEEYISTVKNDYDYIFHMAAINGTSNFYSRPNQVLYNNTISDLSIFKFVSSNKNCRLIYSSSSEVIAGTEHFPTAEEIDIKIKNIHNARWSYRIPKILSENYLSNSDLDFIIVRFFNIFSEESGPGHFVRDIVEKIKKNDFSIVGANETRSFCHVNDTIEPLIALAFSDCRFCNLGSDKEISILSAAKIIAENLGYPDCKWTFLDGNQGSVLRRVPDLTVIRKYVPSFNPRSFADAIEDIKDRL